MEKANKLADCVKVVFKAKIKSSIPKSLLENVRNELQKMDGFISFHSEIVNNIEITTSFWKSQEAIKMWSRYEKHSQAKMLSSNYYTSYEISIENQKGEQVRL